MTTVEKIFDLIQKSGKTDYAVKKDIGLPNSSLSEWRAGRAKPSADALAKLADYFDVSVDYLLGRVDTPTAYFHPSNEVSLGHLVKMPVIGCISAGYDGVAVEDIIDEFEVPERALRGYPKEDCFVLKVKGDSMYPDYKDKDFILVHRQQSVDSGDVAVMLYNGDEATIKKVNYKYGEDWMELEPRNPEFQTKRIEGADLEECHVLGRVLGIVWREV